MKRGGRIRAVSAKRARELKQYSQLRREFLDARPVCEWCSRARAVEVHHRKGRVGRLLLATEHWMALCRACHETATVSPAWAYDNGLSERRIGGAA